MMTKILLIYFNMFLESNGYFVETFTDSFDAI